VNTVTNLRVALGIHSTLYMAWAADSMVKWTTNKGQLVRPAWGGPWAI
jgi:hypothetical protein